jgi:hypothetical protein
MQPAQIEPAPPLQAPKVHRRNQKNRRKEEEGMDQKSILEMARGAIAERVDVEMGRVMENIADPNTKSTEKRIITLKL